ncbi:MAG: PP2C family protein-serine/threonine phosphatase [Phycisphaerae bacterium]|nr:PP2C family protein-serine/threonine phosphatase [Phycisphaerae bacterium]
MATLPDDILRPFCDVCTENLRPAYVRLDAQGRVASGGGDLTHFGLPAELDHDLPDALAFLASPTSDPAGEAIPCLQVGEGRYADIHVRSTDDGRVILLLDTTEQALQHQLIQQNSNDLALLQRRLRRQNEALELANRRIREDLEAAARIQQGLLPDRLPQLAGAHFNHAFIPCDELAGDILNVFPLDDEHVALYLLDVSGHGVRAALLSVTLSRFLSPDDSDASLMRTRPPGSTRSEPADPAQVVAALNQRFPMSEVPAEAQYFTLFYGVLQTHRRELRYVSAGHPPPILVDKQGTSAELDGSDFPVGWVPGAEYQTRTRTLDVGDRLYIYSDGINEAQDANGQMLGQNRLGRLLADQRPLELGPSVTAALDELEAWSAPPFADDVSILAMEITPP